MAATTADKPQPNGGGGERIACGVIETARADARAN